MLDLYPDDARTQPRLESPPVARSLHDRMHRGIVVHNATHNINIRHTTISVNLRLYVRRMCVWPRSAEQTA